MGPVTPGGSQKPLRLAPACGGRWADRSRRPGRVGTQLLTQMGDFSRGPGPRRACEPRMVMCAQRRDNGPCKDGCISPQRWYKRGSHGEGACSAFELGAWQGE